MSSAHGSEFITEEIKRIEAQISRIETEYQTLPHLRSALTALKESISTGTTAPHIPADIKSNQRYQLVLDYIQENPGQTGREIHIGLEEYGYHASYAAVTQAIRELRDLGMLEVVDGKGKGNHLRVHPDYEAQIGGKP